MPRPSPPIAVVTGSNVGIGLQTAHRLAAAGYTVVIACRSASKGAAAAAEVGHGAHYMALDLSSLADTARFASALATAHPRVHALVLNAGIAPGGAEASAPMDSGYERVFQVNFLAHFLLLDRCLPLLRAAAAAGGSVPVRLVCLSSVTHWLTPAGIDWPRVIHARASAGGRAYGISKLAMALLAKEMQRRLEAEEGGSGGIACLAVNPGAVASDIWRVLPAGLLRSAFMLLASLLFLKPAQGCETSVVAATARTAACGTALVGGLYLAPYRTAPAGSPWWLSALSESLGPFAGARVAACSAQARDALVAREMWEACEAALGEWRRAREGAGAAPAGATAAAPRPRGRSRSRSGGARRGSKPV